MKLKLLTAAICLFALPAFSQTSFNCTALNVFYSGPLKENFSNANSEISITPSVAKFGSSEFSVANGDKISILIDASQAIVNVTLKGGQERLRVWIPKSKKNGSVTHQTFSLDQTMTRINCN